MCFTPFLSRVESRLYSKAIKAGRGCALHNPKYDFNDNILATGASYWVRLAENLLA